MLYTSYEYICILSTKYLLAFDRRYTRNGWKATFCLQHPQILEIMSIFAVDHFFADLSLEWCRQGWYAGPGLNDRARCPTAL